MTSARNSPRLPRRTRLADLPPCPGNSKGTLKHRSLPEKRHAISQHMTLRSQAGRGAFSPRSAYSVDLLRSSDQNIAQGQSELAPKQYREKKEKKTDDAIFASFLHLC